MSPNELLAAAVSHLQRAAALAEQDSPDGDALAGQIRLAAATIPTTGSLTDVRDVTDVRGDHARHLELALACLDEIDPLDGPADLPLIAWHVHELHRIAATAGAS